MSSTDFSSKMHELVVNWKLRLVVSALFSILGFAFFIGTLSGYFMDNFETLDQTIVGVAVFVVVIPVYLILADLPNIDEYTIAKMLNDAVPDLEHNAELVLKPEEDLSDEEKARRQQVREVFEGEKLYRFLPNRPIQQAITILITSLLLTAGVYFYF